MMSPSLERVFHPRYASNGKGAEERLRLATGRWRSALNAYLPGSLSRAQRLQEDINGLSSIYSMSLSLEG